MLLVSLRTADVSPGSSPLRDVSRMSEEKRLPACIFAAYFMLACSQTLYFLFKVRRARVIKYGPQGIYDVFEKNEKKNKTTSVYSLVSCREVVTIILIF